MLAWMAAVWPVEITKMPGGALRQCLDARLLLLFPRLSRNNQNARRGIETVVHGRIGMGSNGVVEITKMPGGALRHINRVCDIDRIGHGHNRAVEITKMPGGALRPVEAIAQQQREALDAIRVEITKMPGGALRHPQATHCGGLRLTLMRRNNKNARRGIATRRGQSPLPD
jgi:hypothetical protein